MNKILIGSLIVACLGVAFEIRFVSICDSRGGTLIKPVFGINLYCIDDRILEEAK